MPGTTIPTRRGAIARRRARLAAVAAAGAVLAACGSSRPGAPRPTSVTPDLGSQDVPVAVRIRGDGFAAQVSSDFSGGGAVMDARFRALLGDTPLDDVALQHDGSIAATVPVGMAAGTYDLTVLAPDGRSGTLARAYRVVAPGVAPRRSVSYRVEAVGPQVAFQPFAVVVTAVDASGEVVSDFAGSVLLSDRTGTVVPARVGLFSRGRWAGPVELRAPHAGDVLTVTDAEGGTGSSASFPVAPAPAAGVRLDAAAAAGSAGECAGPLTLSLADAFGQPTVAAAATALAVEAVPAAGFTLHADAACATPAATPVIAAGRGSLPVWFTATAAGPLRLSASGTSLAPAAQAWSVTAGAPAGLAFVTAPLSAVAGACSAAATVEIRDAFGNPSPDGVAAIGVAATPPTGLRLFSDAACATPATSLAVASGATRATFHFSGTAAGTVIVTATSGSLTPATQTETILTAVATRLAFSTAAQTVEAGACSGAATVQAQDGTGNPSAPSASSATAVTLSGPGLSFHAGTGCGGAPVTGVSIPAGETSATFSFTGRVAGDVTVSASGGGLSDGSQVETVLAAPAIQLAFATAAQTVEAGACSWGVVTVQAQDTYGNPSAPSPSAATPVSLSGPGLDFHAGAGCAGAGTTAVSIPAGATAAAFSFRGTTAGTVTVTATASGLGWRGQDQTIVAAPLDHLAWTTIASPRTSGVAFAVGLSALDAHGNLAAYSGTATLAASPGSVLCTTSCTSGSATAAFTAGQWSGTVTVPSAATGVTLTATASGRAGASNAFDVQVGPALRSPPLATFVATPRVAISGEAITFDASGSSDHQTPAADLQVSWDFLAASYADYASTAAPGTGRWTGWSASKTASHAVINTGASAVVYRPRLAVRDTEAGPGGPDLGHAAGLVVIVPNGTDRCIVDTASLVDDGATDCYAKGTDGRLSLTEAVRLANSWPRPLNITFSDPMVITSTAKLSLTRAVRILGVPGVVLDGVSFDVSREDVLLSGLEIEHLTTTISVRAMGLSDAVFEDLYIHDGAGILVQGGNARLRNVRMSGCAGACVREATTSSWLGVFGGDFQGTGGVGIAIDGCSTQYPGTTSSSPYQAWTFNGWSSSGAAGIFASVFTGFDTAISVGSSSLCRYPYLSNLTFDRNAIAVSRSASAGTGGYLYDSVFTRQTVAAVDPAACGFATTARNGAWQNASVGCLVPDLTADPLHVWPLGRDYRIQYESPLKDTADAGNHVEVDGAGPGLYLGAAPDRGGRETY